MLHCHSENDQQKCRTGNQYRIFFSLHKHVKGFLWKCTGSKVDIGPWNILFAGVYVYIFKSRYVIGPWNIPFAGVYVYIFQLRNVTGLGSEGVKYFVSKFWFSQFRFSWYTAPLFFLNDHHSQSLHHLPDQVLAVHVQAYLVCTRLITFSDLLRNTCTAFGSTCLTPLLPSNKFCHWE